SAVPIAMVATRSPVISRGSFLSIERPRRRGLSRMLVGCGRRPQARWLSVAAQLLQDHRDVEGAQGIDGGLPAALGAEAADPRVLVCILGDPQALLAYPLGEPLRRRLSHFFHRLLHCVQSPFSARVSD